jgi:diguanylate cyclase (GGDEF)-like protein/PAS domain S-box-containing protein
MFTSKSENSPLLNDRQKLGSPELTSASHENDGIIALADLNLEEHYDNASDAIKNKILHEQTYGQFAVLRYAALNTLIWSSLSLVALWPTVSLPILLTWYSVTNAISIVRHLFCRQFFKKKPTGAAIKNWLRFVLIATVSIALSWCALIWITWSIHDIKAISFIAFILAAIAFGSYAGLGLYIHAYLGAASPLFIGLAIMFGHMTSDSALVAIVTVATILIIGLGMLTNSRNASRIWRNTLVLMHEHQSLAREHHEKSAVLSTTLHSIGDGVLTIDANGFITYINPAAELLTGYTLQEVIGKQLGTSLRLNDEADGEKRINIDMLFMQVNESIKVPGELVLTNTRNDKISIEVTISPLYISEDVVNGYVITLHDVTSFRILTRDLSYQALHDPLTGLLNRRGFEVRIQEALVRKQTSEIEHSLCYIDLDYFKAVNDTYGHKAGDEVLLQVVRIAQKCIRDSDSFGRLGGDEFSILLYGCSLDKAEKIVEDICKSVANHVFSLEQKNFSVGVSIGLVPILRNDTSTSLHLAADSACYQAKAQGRGQVHTSSRVLEN